MSNYKNNDKPGMNLKEAMEEITEVIEIWEYILSNIASTNREKEALEVLTAHCKPYIGVINAMQGRKCFNATQKTERK